MYKQLNMGNTSSQNTAPPLTPAPPIGTGVPPVPTPPTTQLSDRGHFEQEQAPVIPIVESVPEVSANPGTYEQLHLKCKELFPLCFESGKVVIAKGLSSNFQTSHTLLLNNPQTSGYRFGATYVGSKQISPQESYPILLGDIDTSGNLNCNIIHGFSKNVVSRVVAQFQGDQVNTQLGTDYRGSTCSGSVTIVNPDLLNTTGIIISQYLQRVTPNFDLGAECTYHRGGHIPGGQAAFLGLSARLQGEKWTFGGTVSPSGPTGPGCHATFYQKVNDSLQIGTEIETSLGMGECTASAGYQFDIPSSGFCFKGMLDTNWNVQATMEKKIMEANLPFTFVLSAAGNQAKSDYKFGVGFMLGQ